jgi:hypothetical protein
LADRALHKITLLLGRLPEAVIVVDPKIDAERSFKDVGALEECRAYDLLAA